MKTGVTPLTISTLRSGKTTLAVLTMNISNVSMTTMLSRTMNKIEYLIHYLATLDDNSINRQNSMKIFLNKITDYTK